MSEQIMISSAALQSIYSILDKGNDVLIKYKKNKNEIEILEQKLYSVEKIKMK